MINSEILQHNLNILSLREIYEYMNIIQTLCRRYENMLKGYYGPIDNPQEPWVRKAKDNFNFYNEIYMEILDFCEQKIKELNNEKVKDNKLELDNSKIEILTPITLPSSEKDINYNSENTIIESTAISIENKPNEKKVKNVKKNKK